MESNRKLIFLDIDGTMLVPGTKEPSALMKQAVSAARALGHKVFISSGRNVPMIVDEIKNIGFDGTVSSAGARIEVDGNVILDDIMTEKLLQECMDIFDRNHILYNLEAADGIYLDHRKEAMMYDELEGEEDQNALEDLKAFSSVGNVRDLSEYKQSGVYKLSFISKGEAALIEPMQVLQDRFYFVKHSFLSGGRIYCGEIYRKGVDKGTAIDRICAHYGLPLADTIAFGDSMNDLQMIQTAGMGIAMGNASSQLKTHADMVCKSVEEDGVYYMMKELGII